MKKAYEEMKWLEKEKNKLKKMEKKRSKEKDKSTLFQMLTTCLTFTFSTAPNKQTK